MMIWIWLGAIVLFGAVEGATASLVSIWFVAGAAVALIAAILNVSIGMQFAIFLAVSAVALAVTRPLVRKMKSGKPIPTNLDRVIGLTGKVTETVDNENATGAVYVDGKTWTARSADGTVFPEGSFVTISKMEGVKLFVDKNIIVEGTR
jgi:membrane protein implicated in regulation of membrane protease activity